MKSYQMSKIEVYDMCQKQNYSTRKIYEMYENGFITLKDVVAAFRVCLEVIENFKKRENSIK